MINVSNPHENSTHAILQPRFDHDFCSTHVLNDRIGAFSFWNTFCKMENFIEKRTRHSQIKTIKLKIVT